MARPRFNSGSSDQQQTGPTITPSVGPDAGGTGVYTPPVEAAPSDTAVNTAGRLSLNPLTPVDFGTSVGTSVENGKSVIDGLGEFLFGKQSLLGNNIGPIAMGASDLVGKGIHAVVAPVIDAVTSMPNPIMPMGNSMAVFMQSPDTPSKQLVMAKIKSDPIHAMRIVDEYVAEQARQKQMEQGSLFPDAYTPSTFGAQVEFLMNSAFSPLNILRTAAERTVAGAKDRVGAILQIGSGQATYGDGSGLDQVEQVVYDRVSSGLWTRDQGADFLTANGKGFANDAATEIAGSIALDPLTIITLAAGAFAKLGATGVKSLRSAQMGSVIKALEAGDTARAELFAERVAATVGEGATKADMLDQAEGVIRLAKASGRATPEFFSGLRGRLAGSKFTNEQLVRYGEFYQKYMMGTRLGSSARTIRAIIDPFAYVGHRGAAAQQLEAFGRAVTLAADNVMGEIPVAQMLHGFNESPDGATLVDDITRAAADGVGNVARTVVGLRSQAEVLAFEIANKATSFGTPGAVVDETILKQPKNRFLVDLRQKLISAAKPVFTADDDRALARRMSTIFGRGTEEEWLARIAGDNMTLGQKQFLHLAAYGRANRGILEAAAELSKAFTKGKFVKLIPRLVLINKDRLAVNDVFHLLEELAADVLPPEAVQVGFKTLLEMKLAIVADYAARIPEFRRMLAGLLDKGLTEAEQTRLLDLLVKKLEGMKSSGRLPSRLTTKEIAELSNKSGRFRTLMSEIEGTYDVGFRPEDDKLWGLDRDIEGNLMAAYEPWVDHVVDQVPNARRIDILATNALGMPIIGKKVAAVARSGIVGKPVDYLVAASRMMSKRINGAIIVEAARQRAIGRLVDRYGMDETQAKSFWAEVSKALQVDEVSPRAMRQEDIWEKVSYLVPYEMRATGKMTSRDVMDVILRAYEGDFRIVGATQKLTGAMKTRLGGVNGNLVGFIAEDGFPTLRFKYNPIFQLQRRFDSMTLLPLRGILPVFGTKLTENDLRTAALLGRMRNTGIVRIVESDMVEYSKLMQYGQEMISAMGSIKDPKWWQSVTQIATAEKLGYLRTIQDDLGRALPKAFAASGGDWASLAEHYSLLEGKQLSDGEVAVRYLLGQAYGNDIKVLDTVVRPGVTAADFGAAIRADMWTPSHIGEVRPLGMDNLVQFLLRDGPMKGSDGNPIVFRNAFELKTLLRPGKDGSRARLSWSMIEDALRAHGAHPDYIRRVQSALEFDYPDFIATLTRKFGLKADEVDEVERIIDGAARVRGATPAEFLSQVFSPTVGTGRDAVIGEMGKTVSMLRANKKGGTYDQLMRQLSDVFIAHLDPSAREGLLRAFGKDVASTAPTVWSDAETEAFVRAVSDRITGVTAAPPKGAKAAAAAGVNPDVERAVQWFGKWARETVGKSLRSGKDSALEQIVGDLKRLPSDSAIPYNQMSASLASAYANVFREAEQDAFKLLYYSRDRSWLERSVNHMFFGIYPASYMWGKVLPEIVNAVAREPFGLHTGAANIAANDLRMSIAAQVELDPAIADRVEKWRRNGVWWMLMYMMPAEPWDLGAGAPPQLSAIANKALENQQRIERGLKPKEIDLFDTFVTKTVKKAIPETDQLDRMLSGLGDIVGAGKKAPKSYAPTLVDAGAGPVKATQLQGTLEQATQDLQQVLFAP